MVPLILAPVRQHHAMLHATHQIWSHPSVFTVKMPQPGHLRASAWMSAIVSRMRGSHSCGASRCVPRSSLHSAHT